MEKPACSLCQLPIGKHSTRSSDELFCCHGCQAVYEILKAQGSLDKDFQNTPTFQQALKHGLISNPDLLKQMSEKDKKGEVLKLQLEISDMWCYSCSKLIEYALMQLKGVQQVFVDYTTDLSQVLYDPKCLSSEEIIKELKALGYEGHNIEDMQENKKESFSLYLRLFVGVFCTLNIMMFSYPIYASHFSPEKEGYALFFAKLAGLFSLPVIGYTGMHIWKRLYKGFAYGLYGMELLVALGVGASFGLSALHLSQGSSHVYFDSMSVIITLVLLGKIIEKKAKFSARSALMQLHKSLAKKGRRLFEGREEFVSLSEVRVGESLVAYKGERLVADGILLSDEAYVDESSITGESLPRRKTYRQALLSGSVLVSEKISYEVLKEQSQSVMQQIIDTLQHDLHSKTPYIRAVEKVLHYFVPIVVILAFGGAFFELVKVSMGLGYKEVALNKFLSVLLISCPCAIGIAAPLAEASLINRLVKGGVIVRNRGSLSLIPKLQRFAFDKTGTLTEGRLSLIKGLGGLSDHQKNYLKSLSQQSSHPICRAIDQALDCRAIPLENFQEVIGKGVIATSLEGEPIILGSASFLKERGYSVKEEEGEELLCFFGQGNRAVCTLVFQDRLRKGFKELMAKLPRCSILSGDRKQVVQKVALELGIVSYYAPCMPLEKKAHIEKWQEEGELVAFIGDGINDAPALTKADVGISVLKASDISIQVSDIFITKENPSLILKMRDLAKLGQAIIQQNLFWAFFYNVIGIFLALGGYLWPLYAAIAMGLSSLMICLNSWRLSFTHK